MVSAMGLAFPTLPAPLPAGLLPPLPGKLTVHLESLSLGCFSYVSWLGDILSSWVLFIPHAVTHSLASCVLVFQIFEDRYEVFPQ